MKKKLLFIILWVLLSVAFGLSIVLFEKEEISLGVVLSSAMLALLLEKTGRAFQDLLDTTDWKTTQRKLKRGGFIKDNDLVRISFAYLYRIKVGSYYLLVKNERNTGKYQPVGGVFKLIGNEKVELKNRYHVMDDNKILIDESSKDDYRLRMENKYLRKFVSRFNSEEAERERIDNAGREFSEELIEKGILSEWSSITYRYCGRYISELRFSDHFQMYELLLFDIVELIPTAEQEQELKKLIHSSSNQYCFATAEQIACLGMNIDQGMLYERIGDHSRHILQENESKLMKTHDTGLIFTVEL